MSARDISATTISVMDKDKVIDLNELCFNNVRRCSYYCWLAR